MGQKVGGEPWGSLGLVGGGEPGLKSLQGEINVIFPGCPHAQGVRSKPKPRTTKWSRGGGRGAFVWNVKVMHLPYFAGIKNGSQRAGVQTGLTLGGEPGETRWCLYDAA